MAMAPIRRRRALSPQAARDVRQRGHADAREFALAIGLPSDYPSAPHAKKDVIDFQQNAHSVKSGVKKWQIFLYAESRFRDDSIFTAMDGIGQLLLDCINSFPQSFSDYRAGRDDAKQRLRIPMVRLAQKLQARRILHAFFHKSIFNAGEVWYLTVKHEGKFHVFWWEDVLQALTNNIEVCNSRAISQDQVPEQKVLFRYQGRNLGELEMRNDSPVHYRQIRFNMIKPVIMNLLFSSIQYKAKYDGIVRVYGKADRRFRPGRGTKSR